MTRATFTGGKELERALLELSTKSAQKVGRFALRRAANEILKAAKAGVPVDEGRLKKALRLRVDRVRGVTDLLSALVYASSTAFDYPHACPKGDAAHPDPHLSGALSRHRDPWPP